MVLLPEYMNKRIKPGVHTKVIRFVCVTASSHQDCGELHFMHVQVMDDLMNSFYVNVVNFQVCMCATRAYNSVGK
jgi:hypothetical protein